MGSFECVSRSFLEKDLVQRRFHFRNGKVISEPGSLGKRSGCHPERVGVAVLFL